MDPSAEERQDIHSDEIRNILGCLQRMKKQPAAEELTKETPNEKEDKEEVGVDSF